MKPFVRPAAFVVLFVFVCLPSTLRAQGQRPPQGAQADLPNGQIAATRPGSPTGPGPAQPAPSQPAAPFPPLNAEHQKYLDQLLTYWEQHSQNIKKYRCKFKRWEYDSLFGPKAHDQYKNYSEGEIRYSAPDKGLFKVEKTWAFAPPGPKNAEPEYRPREDGANEHWLCDGQSIFEYDGEKKSVTERQLPPDLRGMPLADGPMPFMFGAKAERIKQRYWLQVITPADAKEEYWLEAWPKLQEDAASFQKVWIVLDQKQFLPRMLQIFDRSYNERAANFNRTVFVFDEREVNSTVLNDLLHGKFFEPTVPLGWKKVVVPYQDGGKATPARDTGEKKSAGFGLPRMIFRWK